LSTILIRRLAPSDAAVFQVQRLTGLRECPSAFSSSYEEECDTSLSTIARYFDPDSGRNRFGAFDGERLAGTVGVGRENGLKLRHKSYIRGMYVAPAYRGRGVGRQLMEYAIAFASQMEGVSRITLAVTAGNASAIALYESLGFQSYGCERGALIVDGVPYDEILMVHNITPGSGPETHELNR
jgi:ribosomal protein S18 acetylase RimI-like enzyme